MKISIIVPVYNVENVLHYCVDSILAQTYKDFELILVDDGSTDKSGELCDKYAEKNKNVAAIHIKNGGVSKARNTGIELAQGEYLCFIDSDDYISKVYLEELLEAHNHFPNCDNIWCGFQTVDGYDNSEVIHNVFYSDAESVSFSSTKEIMTLHEKWLDAGPVCKLYKKCIIDNNRIRFPEDLSLGEDLVFNYDYLDCTSGDIIIINKCLYNYVKQNYDSLTNIYHEDLFYKYIKVFSLVYSYLIKWNCDCNQITAFYNNCFYMYEFALRNTFKHNSKQTKKFKYNRNIMKSVDFKNALNNSSCYINPVYRFGYSHYLSVFIWLLDRIIIRS